MRGASSSIDSEACSERLEARGGTKSGTVSFIRHSGVAYVTRFGAGTFYQDIQYTFAMVEVILNALEAVTHSGVWHGCLIPPSMGASFICRCEEVLSNFDRLR